jgi:hypothetical protein
MSMSHDPKEPQSQQRHPFDNASTPPEPPVSTSNPGSGLMRLLHPGELLGVIGGIITLTAFYNLPLLSSDSFTVTGKDLASSRWQLTRRGWRPAVNAAGERWLLWLMVLFVLMMMIVSALRLLGIVSRSEKTSRLLFVSGDAAVLLLLIGFFTQYATSLISGFWLGIGFWLTLVGVIVMAIGGYLEIRPYLHIRDAQVS